MTITPEPEGDWDDILGTGTVLKQVLERGRRNEDPDLDMEAPRKFFALIDIETKCQGVIIESESHKNYLINSDADLFAGAHLVIPLMDVDEQSRYIFDPKFAFGSLGLEPLVPTNSKLECIITLKFRSPYDEFLNQLQPGERLKLANRKKDRGKFWFLRGDYHNAITIYQSLNDLCLVKDTVDVDVDGGGDDDHDGGNNNSKVKHSDGSIKLTNEPDRS